MAIFIKHFMSVRGIWKFLLKRVFCALQMRILLQVSFSFPKKNENDWTEENWCCFFFIAASFSTNRWFIVLIGCKLQLATRQTQFLCFYFSIRDFLRSNESLVVIASSSSSEMSSKKNYFWIRRINLLWS